MTVEGYLDRGVGGLDFKGIHGKKTDAHFTPDAEMAEKIDQSNEELKKAGTLLSLDGLIQ